MVDFAKLDLAGVILNLEVPESRSTIIPPPLRKHALRISQGGSNKAKTLYCQGIDVVGSSRLAHIEACQ